MSLEPVEIVIEQDHAFKKRQPDPETGCKRIGCATCGRSKHDRAHLGAPPSMNSGNHSMHPQAYQVLKHAWQDALRTALGASGLPRGLARVTVEGMIGFPTLANRDQGNHRWMIEKALGDTLVAGGWLPDDRFYPDAIYEFGGLSAVHDKGRSWTRLMIFPSAASMEMVA